MNYLKMMVMVVMKVGATLGFLVVLRRTWSVKVSTVYNEKCSVPNTSYKDNRGSLNSYESTYVPFFTRAYFL